MFKRRIFQVLLKRIQEPRRFIQVLVGPRQTGKTTLARQIAGAVPIAVHFSSADEPTLRDRGGLIQQREAARLRSGKDLVAWEVRSGRRRTHRPGMDAFSKTFRPKRQLLIGQEGIELKKFLTTPIDHWLS